jgi:methylaspartate mutase epsilon subunit
MRADERNLRELRLLGFDRVFPGYVSPEEVIATLDADLGTEPGGARGELADLTRIASVSVGTGPPQVADPLRKRGDVLDQWHTGAAARHLADNARILAQRRTLADIQREAAAENRQLIQPRTGATLVGEQRALFARMADVDADVLSFQIDSLTRNNAYEQAGQVIKQRAYDQDSADLNGFPAVNHGVAVLREISAEFRDLPLQVRHSSRDPRLLAEITFAGGVAAYEGGAITYNLPYFRDHPPEHALRLWRYVDRLAGLYRERFGIVIDREFFGVLTASLVPPCLAVVANVLEAMLAVREGVASLSFGYAEQGHRAQDIAAIRALPKVAARYLPDLAMHAVFHQHMGAFPRDLARATEVLRGSAITAALSGARRIMVKTRVEAVRIPSGAENAASLGLVRDTLGAVRGDEVDWAQVAAEEELIVAESTAILDRALAEGGGLPGRAAVVALQRGYLDVPFSPSRWNAGRAVAIRDVAGAVRFADPGDIPLPADVAETHRRLVAARLRARPGRAVEELLAEDVLAAAEGESWPFGGR